VVEATAAGLGRGDLAAAAAELDLLPLDAQCASLTVEVAALQRDDLTDAQVRPKRHRDQALQVLGHGEAQPLHLVEVQQRPLLHDGLAGSAHPAGVAPDELVVDRRVEDGAQQRVGLPGRGRAGALADRGVPLPDAGCGVR
jgi:hypothetical protein